MTSPYESLRQWMLPAGSLAKVGGRRPATAPFSHPEQLHLPAHQHLEILPQEGQYRVRDRL